jgi:hypothetical protein
VDAQGSLADRSIKLTPSVLDLHTLTVHQHRRKREERKPKMKWFRKKKNSQSVDAGYHYAQRFATFHMAHCKGNVLMYLFSASVIVLCRSILPHYADCHHLFLANNANRTSRKTLSKVLADVARVSDIDN